MATNEDQLRELLTGLSPTERAKFFKRLDEEQGGGFGAGVADFGTQFARGLSDAGHATAAGVTDLVGLDRTADKIRRSRDVNRELYGEARGAAGTVGGVAGRLTGELPLFLLPGAGATRLAGAAEAGSMAAKVAAALKGAKGARIAGATLTGVTEAGEKPEESLTGTVGHLTGSGLLKDVSESTLGRAAGGALGGELISEAVVGGAKGLGKLGRMLRPGTEKAAAAAETLAEKAGALLEEPKAPTAYKAFTLKEAGKRSPEAKAAGWTEEILPDGRAKYTPPAEGAAKVVPPEKVSQLKPEAAADFENKLGLIAGEEARPRAEGVISKLKAGGMVNEPTTVAATLEAAAHTNVDDVLQKNGFEMLTGPESQALRMEVDNVSKSLSDMESQLAKMQPTDPQRGVLELEASKAEQRLEAVLERHIKGGSAVGRALRLRRTMNQLAARNSLDPTEWYARAKRSIGPDRDLSSGQMEEIRRLISKGDPDKVADFVTKLGGEISFWKEFPTWMAQFMKGAHLSAPVSWVRPALGGVAQGAWDSVANLPAKVVMNKVVSTLTGARQLEDVGGLGRIGTTLKGAREGFGEVGKIIKGADEKSISPAVRQQQAEVRGSRSLKPIFSVRKIIAAAKGQGKKQVENVPTTALADGFTQLMFRFQGAGDATFRAAAYRSAMEEYAGYVAKRLEGLSGKGLAEEAAARGLTAKDLPAMAAQKVSERKAWLLANPTTEMDLVGNHLADVATYQNSSWAHRKVSDLKRGFSPAARAAADIVVPYSRTPGALFGAAVESTPLGFIGAGSSMGQLKKLVKEADPAKAAELFLLQKQAIRRGSRATTGTILAPVVGAMTLGFQWLKEGRITGAAPESGADRDQFFDSGKQEFSINIKGRWYPIAQLGPLAAPLGMGALLAQNEGGTLSDVAASMAAPARMALNLPLLTGAKSVVGFLEGENKGGRALVPSTLAGVVPSAVGAARRLVDPVQREKTDLSDYPKDRVPGLSNDLPAQVSATTGEPIKSEYSMAARIGELVDPFASSPDRTKNDPVLAEMQRVGAAISGPEQDKTKLSGETTEQFAERQQTEGKIWNQVMSAFMNPTEQTVGYLGAAGITGKDFQEYQQLKAGAQNEETEARQAELIEKASRAIRTTLTDERRDRVRATMR